MPTNWQVPSSSEQAEGVIALMPLVYYHSFGNGTFKALEYGVLRYTEVMLRRRAARGDDLPKWWEYD